jgi:hypothetical protein
MKITFCPLFTVHRVRTVGICLLTHLVMAAEIQATQQESLDIKLQTSIPLIKPMASQLEPDEQLTKPLAELKNLQNTVKNTDMSYVDVQKVQSILQDLNVTKIQELSASSMRWQKISYIANGIGQICLVAVPFLSLLPNNTAESGQNYPVQISGALATVSLGLQKFAKYASLQGKKRFASMNELLAKLHLAQVQTIAEPDEA